MKRLVLFGLCVLLAASSVSQANIDVDAGWDLFFTDDSTTFMGLNWEGVPLGTFDFGGTIGVEDTGGVDTIMQRIDQASVAGDGQTDTIDIELVALQLVSTTQFDIGAGTGYHYITLQTGQSSTGTMDITFDDADGGTFDSFFDVYFDLRFGGVDGTILDSDSIVMTSSDNSWSRIAPDLGAIVIEDVDYLLNGTTTVSDFWPGSDPSDPGGPGGVPDKIHQGPHTVSTPEPATLCLLGLGGLLLRRRKSA